MAYAAYEFCLMDDTLQSFIEKTRLERGPFFLARVALRTSFALDKPLNPTLDSSQCTEEFLAACRELGYDPSASS